MDKYDDPRNNDGETDDVPEDFVPDVSTVAFLDQQQAEFEGMADEFESTYGFKHDCHCGEDYAAGRVGEITQCYHNMMQEALATCARMNIELKEVTGIAQALYAELADRVQAEEGSKAVQPEPLTEADTGVQPFADDAAGEGLGVSGDARVSEGHGSKDSETGNESEGV